MWNFLARNKQVGAMLGLLSVAAVLTIILTTKGGSHAEENNGVEEPEDVSPATHVFSTYRLVCFISVNMNALGNFVVISSKQMLMLLCHFI